MGGPGRVLRATGPAALSVRSLRLPDVEPDLFTAAAEERQEKDPSSSPLAVRMRPRVLDEVLGQQHLLKQGSPLRRLVGEAGGGPAGPSSVILWGPPGTGKTTLAYVVSKATNKRFVELSAITAGVKEVRAVIDGARRASGGFGKETVLFLDEIHRFSKAQQDSLLPAVENRWVTLIAATTENPISPSSRRCCRAPCCSPWNPSPRTTCAPCCAVLSPTNVVSAVR